jgi:hypothetical protein
MHEAIRLICIVRIDAPDQLDSVFEYQKERIGDQYQHHLVAPVEQPRSSSGPRATATTRGAASITA